MKAYDITLYGDPILRQKTKDVHYDDPDLPEIIERMFASADLYGGIGLAANQVGLLKRIFIMNYVTENGEKQRRVYLNPRIISSSGSVTIEEGCLSFPEIRIEVTRPEYVTVKYTTPEGETVTEEMDGMSARVAQHEIDHLDGIYFIDRISSIRRKMLRKKLKAIAEGKVRPPIYKESLKDQD